MVTMQPLSNKASSNSGMAVISFDFHLPQCQSKPVSERGYQVQGLSAGRLRTLGGFAVDGDGQPLQRATHLAHPRDEAFFEPGRVQQREYPPEGVVRGHTVLERKKLPQPRQLGLPPQRHPRPAVRAAQYRADRHQQQFLQIMPRLACARVFQVGKMLQ